LFIYLFIEKQEEDILKMDYPKDYTMMAQQTAQNILQIDSISNSTIQMIFIDS